MNNNMEKYVEETFDEMLDSVKSINDDFINNYFENDEADKPVEESKEFYDKDSLKELSNDLNSMVFNIEEPIKKDISLLETEDGIIDLIGQTNSSEEFFNILEGKKND